MIWLLSTFTDEENTTYYCKMQIQQISNKKGFRLKSTFTKEWESAYLS